MAAATADWEVCFPPENWFALNRRLPTAQTLVMAQTGHGPQHQYAELVAEYVSSFVQRT